MNNNALVYIHIFADGSKYFGNAVNPKRPWDFNKRNDKWLNAFATNGAPVVQIKRNMTVCEADALEQWLFDRHVANGGVKMQQRPSGNDLANASFSGSRNKGNQPSVDTKQKISIAQKGKNLSDDHKKKLSEAKKGRQLSEETKQKMSEAKKGKPKSEAHIKAVSAKVNRKVISMLDGRITIATQVSRWNKKNPEYAGTWVDL